MDKYLSELGELINPLSKKQKLVFAFWISKRLFSNYAFFNMKTSFGDTDVLLDGLNLIEKYLFENDFRKEEIMRSIADIEENTPDTNDYPQITVSFALDACTALTESLNYIVDSVDQRIIDIASFARDTVDMFVQEKEDLDYEDPEFELKVQNDEFMRKEVKAQRDFLTKLKTSDLIPLRSSLTFDEIIQPNLIT